MTVSLILTPEVGVHYANSGLPKDIISKPENIAQHSHLGQVVANVPPNSFGIPSLHSSEFLKRYYSFLSRMDSLLAGLPRSQSNVLEGASIFLTGSFWKYYRSPRSSTQSAFGGLGGDYSSSAGLTYRQRLEQYFAQREFADPNPAAANRWKTRQLDEVNRRWFNQQSEEVFRNRTYQSVRRKSAAIPCRELELFTPEADPANLYSSFLQQLSGGNADFAKLSALVDDAGSRASMGAAGSAAPFLHWTGLGGFRSLADPEKQFLILKSLLLMGGRGGGILVDETEWFSLSSAFRARVEAFGRSIAHGELRLRNRAVYLASHLWSSAGTLWEELYKRLGSGARMIASLDLVMRESDSNLAIVDPSYILTQEAVQKLCAWARGGRVVVMPRSPLYTEMARTELELLAAQTKRIEIDLGVPYRLHALGDGKLIVYDLPESLSMSGEILTSWQTFLTAVLSVAEVEGYCRLSDARLAVIPLETRAHGQPEGLGMFVMNGTTRQVTADILFPEQVAVSDLALALAGTAQKGTGQVPANRYTLEVPPCGVLPLAVSGIESAEARERQLAAREAVALKDAALRTAMSELSGFDGRADAFGDEGLGEAASATGRLPSAEESLEGSWN